MKNIILILCCLLFAFSGAAQPNTQKFYEKFYKETLSKTYKPARDLKSNRFTTEILKPEMPKTKILDWWEPDTICLYGDKHDNRRYLFSYKNENRSSQLYQEWQSGEWRNINLEKYTYDSQDNIKEELTQYWNNNQWENSYLYKYTYDTQSNITEKLFQRWSNNQWGNVDVEKYSYDAQNRITEVLVQNWTSSNQWVNEIRVILVYDDPHNKIEITFQEWYYGDWESIWRILSTLDERGNPIEEIYQDYEEEEEVWESYMRYAYTFDQQNNWVEWLMQYWNDEWENEIKYVFNYDSQNNMIEETAFVWYGSWEYALRTKVKYDIQNNATEYLFQDRIDDQWVNEEMLSNTYDENNNAIVGFTWEWNGNDWVEGMTTINIFYNNMQSVFREMGFYKYTASYLKPSELFIPENPRESMLKLYPNPVSNILYIEIGDTEIIPEIKIYSIQGVLLMNTKGNQIDVSSLPNGFYIANVNEENRKIVKH